MLNLSNKPTNETADMHYLTANDTIFFTNHYNAMLTRIEQIKKDNELKGNWTLSQDFRWLMKTGE